MPVDAQEKLARFIFSKRHFKQGVVLVNAFAPPRDLELSVTRHLTLAEAEIWDAGREVEQLRHDAGKPESLKGRADFIVADAVSQSLSVVEAPIPPRNHACLVGWPPAVGEDDSLQMAIALQLANKSTWLPVST